MKSLLHKNKDHNESITKSDFLSVNNNVNPRATDSIIDGDIVDIVEEYESQHDDSPSSFPYKRSFALSEVKKKCYSEAADDDDNDEISFKSAHDEEDGSSSSSSSEITSFHHISQDLSPSSSHDHNHRPQRTNKCNFNATAINKSLKIFKKNYKSTSSSSSSENNNKDICILGKQYNSQNDYTSIRSDESSLFWFTYRRDFVELVPYGLTTDAGWGCMLRATQMMLCQALRLHFVGRNWRTPIQRRDDYFIRNVMNWFADFPGADCPFSLHNMIAAGLRYEMLPGEWYGPTTSCYVMRDLTNIHQKQQQSSSSTSTNNINHNEQKPFFRVMVAQEGCVYRDVVEETMTVDSNKNMNDEKDSSSNNDVNTNTSANDLPNHPLDINHTSNVTSSKQLPWDAPLLLLIPLRLGLKSFPKSYHNQLAQIFTLPQSVGCIGGSPRHALWFYGSLNQKQQNNNNNKNRTQLFALDPHTVQTSPQRDYNKRYGAISLSNEYLTSVTCSSPVVIDMDKMDPSLALGFYCANRHDFDNLQYYLQNIDNDSSNGHNATNATTTNQKMFSIIDSAPDYTCNVSALADMMSRVDEVDLGSNDSEDAEDDYVFL